LKGHAKLLESHQAAAKMDHDKHRWDRTRLGHEEDNMARAKANGSGRLEDALATLIQNQAAFLARVSEIDARVAEMERQRIEIERRNDERFARIEALLIEHNRILQALPDVIRDKIGFKVP
jgi:hypothetical protein